MLIINLWGGPGAGKTTIAADLFVRLRRHTCANVELVGEFAKDLCFEDAKSNLQDQVYLLGQQWHRIWRLDQRGVDVAISDSPLGIGIPYIRKRKPDYYDQYVALVHALYNEYLTSNIFVERDVYAHSGYKGKTKHGAYAPWLQDLDRQIREVANPIHTVQFNSMDVGHSLFTYVLPMVLGYMSSKAEEANRAKNS